MNTLRERTIEFVNSLMSENDDKYEYYKLFNVLTILDYKKHNEEKFKKIYFSLVYYNKTKFIRMKEEYFSIVSKLSENKIKIVSFKGFPLYFDIYGNNIRFFNDFDFLYKRDELKKVLDVFERLGYKVKIGNVIREISELKLPINENIYHISLIKENSEKKVFLVELHQNLLKKDLGINLNENDMYNRAIPRVYEKHEVYVFEFYDRLIYLILHLSKHYKHYINQIISSSKFDLKKHYFINLTQIFEIAMLIKTNKEIAVTKYFLVNLKQIK